MTIVKSESDELCRHGHPWSVYGSVGSDGKLRCRECGRLAARRYRQKIAAAKRLKTGAYTIVDWMNGKYRR